MGEITNFSASSSYGVPVLPNPWMNIPANSGKVLFVNPNGPAGAGSGPDACLGTIQAALNFCQDGMGDTIVVYPGTYAENLTVSKAKITIIPAVNTGNAKRVAIAPASGTALDVQTGALSFVASGLRLVGTGMGGAYGCLLGADGARFVGCDFTADADSGLAFLGQDVDDANTGSGTSLEGCIFRECGNNGILQVTDANALFATNVNIIGCQFYLNGNIDIGPSDSSGTETYWYEWNIRGCQFMDYNKAVYLAMSGGDASQAALISGNYFNADTITGTSVALSANIGFAGNFDRTGVINQVAF